MKRSPCGRTLNVERVGLVGLLEVEAIWLVGGLAGWVFQFFQKVFWFVRVILFERIFGLTYIKGLKLSDLL